MDTLADALPQSRETLLRFTFEAFKADPMRVRIFAEPNLRPKQAMDVLGFWIAVEWSNGCTMIYHKLEWYSSLRLAAKTRTIRARAYLSGNEVRLITSDENDLRGSRPANRLDANWIDIPMMTFEVPEQ